MDLTKATAANQQKLIDRLAQRLHVGAPAPAAPAVAAIAAAASLSTAIDLADERLHQIVIPAAWDAAGISFQASHDGIAFGDLFDKAGEILLPAAVVAANRRIVVDPAIFRGIRHLKIRSGATGAPVNQAAQRQLTLVTVPR